MTPQGCEQCTGVQVLVYAAGNREKLIWRILTPLPVKVVKRVLKDRTIMHVIVTDCVRLGKRNIRWKPGLKVRISKKLFDKLR